MKFPAAVPLADWAHIVVEAEADRAVKRAARRRVTR
jgi:hypothetical protein